MSKNGTTNTFFTSGIFLIILEMILIGAFMYYVGADSVSSELHKAVDQNETIREFYFDKYPKSYKEYYTDWKKYVK